MSGMRLLFSLLAGPSTPGKNWLFVPNWRAYCHLFPRNSFAQIGTNTLLESGGNSPSIESGSVGSGKCRHMHCSFCRKDTNSKHLRFPWELPLLSSSLSSWSWIAPDPPGLKMALSVKKNLSANLVSGINTNGEWCVGEGRTDLNSYRWYQGYLLLVFIQLERWRCNLMRFIRSSLFLLLKWALYGCSFLSSENFDHFSNQWWVPSVASKMLLSGICPLYMSHKLWMFWLILENKLRQIFLSSLHVHEPWPKIRLLSRCH